MLKDIVESYFVHIGDPKKVVLTSISPNGANIAHRKNFKDFFGDIICTLDTGEIVLLEAYTNFGIREYKKSYNYMTRNYSNQIKRNKDNYEDTKKVYCLNFSFGNFKRCNDYLVNNYKAKHDITNNIILNGEMEFALIRLDLVNKMVYTKEDRFVKWLKFFNSKDFDELSRIVKGDKIMEQSMEYLKSYCSSSDYRTFDDYVAYQKLYAKEEGEANGEHKKAIETAANLLKMGIEPKVIAKGVNLPLKEVKNIQKNIEN